MKKKLAGVVAAVAMMLPGDASINFSIPVYEVVSDKNKGCFLSKMVTFSFITLI